MPEIVFSELNYKTTMQHITALQDTPFTLIVFLLTLVVFADYNGFINLWGLTAGNSKNRRYYSSMWHMQGWVVRFLITVLVLVYEGLFAAWLATIFGWHLFDILINRRRGHRWYYLGEKYEDYFAAIWALKIVVLLAGLLFLIY